MGSRLATALILRRRFRTTGNTLCFDTGASGSRSLLATNSTLELLVMKILHRGPNHGFAISSYIQQTSDDVLRAEAGSFYPALHRMTEAGLLKAEWRMSEAGRRARFYVLTAKGRRKFEADEKKWRAVSAAVAKILRTASG
jgi:PadR family transcriptional regulator PadR